MYLEHFGLNEPPFRITPHTDFFFQGANRGATLEALLYAITHDEGIVKVSGEVGSGKTMLCRVLIERLPKNVETIYLANPSLARDEILLAIADELKLEADGQRATRLIRALQDHLILLFAQGRRVVVLIDEAHAMPKETLEEIRLLSNLESNRHKLLQIVLFGQPELDAHLNTADMRQLKERITHGFRLEPLVRSDVESYIDFRMRAAGYRGPNVFTPAATKLIAGASEGLTRRVNILADKALLAAFADGTHAVTAAEAKRAIRDSEFYRPPRNLQKLWIGAGALAAGLALGWGVHLMLSAGAARSSAQISPVARAAAPAPGAHGNGAPIPAAPAQSAPRPARAQAGALADLPASTLRVASVTAEIPASPVGIAETAHRGPKPPQQGKITRERFDATLEWLRTAPGDHYAIQLLTAKSSELASMEDFLLKASKLVPVEELLVYSVKIDGQQYYRAAFGSYPSQGETLAAMKQLPPPLKVGQPFPRSVERMRSQNRQ
ncbi:MAG: AAA family ATPase [Burkholderiales bacterium]